jgi:hypothetical protein
VKPYLNVVFTLFRNAASDMSSGESRTGGGSADHRLNSGSPSNNNNNNNNNNLDPNTAAYQALRNHPETTIRPVAPDMRSPHMDSEHSPRNMEDSIFKQVRTYSEYVEGARIIMENSWIINGEKEMAKF